MSFPVRGSLDRQRSGQGADSETLVAIAAGSNLSDRMAHLEAGVRALERLIRLDGVSRVVESPPEGDARQGDYLNLVLVGSTHLGPRSLLAHLLEIERGEGRIRTTGGGESRTLDLDLILHGESVVAEPDLRVPHPRWYVRPFVAQPLLELLPQGIDPETGDLLAERAADALHPPLKSVGRLPVPPEMGVDEVRTLHGKRTR